MSEFSVKEKFEFKIREVWANQNYIDIDVIKRGFSVQDIIKKNSIMFVGINPSYDQNKIDENLEFYTVSQIGKSHPYFNKFKEIAANAKHHWTHLDFLFFKETNQKYVELLEKSINGPEFIMKQLEISKEILIEAKPKILIVSNTKARKFTGFEKNKEQTQGVWMGFDFQFDDNFGTYKIINNLELENTPVFFTSMLTGQRAIDNGSFERLKWHINFVIKQLN